MHLFIGTDLQQALEFSWKKSAKQETMFLGENLQGAHTAIESQGAVKFPVGHQKLIKVSGYQKA